jgi:hypothetical protein
MFSFPLNTPSYCIILLYNRKYHTILLGILCPLGKPEFTPPELQGNRSAFILKTHFQRKKRQDVPYSVSNN